ncbi:septum formation initiator [Actinomadura logoneensis]|uniref:Septum formation initiator n=1 Tax=Actinomadura logoneensis TaxID=2293572 RepID=A0A372JPG8_9ACTN|nr:AAA family ATPase [Actinomadura logoneensis]RFU41925.1 septum formation initiator [Actinomadura logoneensis]
MSIQVLLGVEDRDVALALAGQFRELPDLEVVAVETLSGHVQGTVASVPALDVVMIHEGLGPLPALDLIRDLVSRYPQLAVILIVDEASTETFSAAMAAGARGVIQRDPTLSELQNRVTQAGEWSRTMRRHFSSPQPMVSGQQGTLVTLCGAKGGVGTTTVAIHLAIAVASSGRSVCLIDMDLQNGDIPGYLDIQHRHTISDLAAAGDLDAGVVSEALYVHKSGPHLLLAPGNGEDAEEVSARTIRQILTLVRSRYEVVIVDGGTHVSDANAMAVELADELVVVATPDVPALRSARRLTDLFARLTIRKPEDATVLLTRTDRKNEIQPDLAKKMIGAARLREAAIPAVFRALEEAANTGSPAAVKNNDFRKAVGRLAGELDLVRAPASDGRGKGRGGPKDRGGVSLDFAAIFPMILLVGLLCWQVVLVGLTSMYSSHASNAAARAVAVIGYDKSPTRQGAANREEVRRRAVERVYGGWKDKEHLSVDVEGDYAVVTIDVPILIPGLGSSWGITTKSKIVHEDE